MKNFKSRTTGMMQVLGACLALFLLTKCSEAKTTGTTPSSDGPKMTIHEATFMGDVEEINKHINGGTDLNQKDQYGSSPLTIAATFGKTAVAIALIDAGADLKVQSADGSTPLHTAAFFGRTEIVKTLLKKGADPALKNGFGATALESVSAPFSDMKAIYDQISRDLGPFGLKLDYDELEKTRPVIAEMIRNAQ